MNIIGFWNISDDNNILTQNNTQQMLPPIEGNFITTHCSVNQEQHKKVRIQIEAYQEAITKSQINLLYPIYIKTTPIIATILPLGLNIGISKRHW